MGGIGTYFGVPTVDLRLHDLGHEAGLRLRAMIDGEQRESGIVRLPCSLVVRDSCGAPGGDTTVGEGAYGAASSPDSS